MNESRKKVNESNREDSIDTNVEDESGQDARPENEISEGSSTNQR